MISRALLRSFQVSFKISTLTGVVPYDYDLKQEKVHVSKSLWKKGVSAICFCLFSVKILYSIVRLVDMRRYGWKENIQEVTLLILHGLLFCNKWHLQMTFWRKGTEYCWVFNQVTDYRRKFSLKPKCTKVWDFMLHESTYVLLYRYDRAEKENPLGRTRNADMDTRPLEHIHEPVDWLHEKSNRKTPSFFNASCRPPNISRSVPILRSGGGMGTLWLHMDIHVWVLGTSTSHESDDLLDEWITVSYFYLKTHFETLIESCWNLVPQNWRLKGK